MRRKAVPRGAARPLKAISILQPWASLVVHGLKRVETRSWSTPHQGRLLIHASAKWSLAQSLTCLKEHFHQALRDTGIDLLGGPDKVPSRKLFPLGVIVGWADLVSCQHTGAEPGLVDWIDRLDERERAFGDYTPMRYGWLLERPHKLDEPIPAKGALGMWSVPEDVADKLPAEAFAGVLGRC